METREPFRIYYDNLVKPSWTPDPSVIGTIWTILYPIIVTVFGIVLYRVFKESYPPILAVLIGLNVVSNLAFTYFQFGLRNNPLAFVDLLVILGTAIAIIAMLWNLWRPGSYLLLPYALWVSIAGTLQFFITINNR